MRKLIFAIATLAALSTGTAMAQRGYDPGYNRYPAPSQTNPRYDDAQDEMRIDRLDAIVGLSRKQERDLRKIEEHYDRLGLMPGSRLPYRDIQQLQWQKRQDVMAVLTRDQRNRLMAYQQQYNRNNRGGYPNRNGYPDRGGYDRGGYYGGRG